MILNKKQVELVLDTVVGCMKYSRDAYGMPNDIATKKDGSIAILVDVNVEKRIFVALKEALPSAGCIGEEADEKLTLAESEAFAKEMFEKKTLWVVDPIDGTDNFASGTGEFAISIGLLSKTDIGWQPIFGVVAMPMSGLIYVSNGVLDVYRLDGKELISLPNHGQQLWKQDFPKKAMFSINGSRVPMYKLGKNVSLRSPGCTVTQILGVAAGNFVGSVVAEHIWDFAGVLAIGAINGYCLYDVETLTKVEGITLDMFQFTSIKLSWKLKEHYYYCHPKHLAILKTRITKL